MHDWLEIIGLFGVIASLSFVGLQLKQDREIAIAAAYQARATTAIDTFLAIAANETVLRALIKAQSGDPDATVEGDGFAAPLTALELLAGNQATNAIANLADNSYYQYQAGFLPHEHWLAVRALIKSVIIVNPLYRISFTARPNNFRPEFNAMMDEIVAEIDVGQGM